MGVDVPVLSNDDCDTYLYYRGSIFPGMLCMGYLEDGGKDSCQVSSYIFKNDIIKKLETIFVVSKLLKRSS